MIPLPALPALTGLLTNKYVWAIGGLIIVFLGIFFWGYSVGSRGKAEVKAEFEQYKAEQALWVKEVQKVARKDALAANQQLKNEERRTEENARQQQKQLAKMRKKLDDEQLERALVLLLDDAARAGEHESLARSPEQANESVVQGPGSPNLGSGVRIPQVEVEVTLGDLAEVTIENNKNHWNCVQQVQAWQEFYDKLYNQFEPR